MSNGCFSCCTKANSTSVARHVAALVVNNHIYKTSLLSLVGKPNLFDKY